MAVSHNNTTKDGFDKPVQERLLDAAEELFCEHGFEGTSVRNCTSRCSDDI
ncbi:MAG: TetR/AcrR family transcriptional regulator [Planctomycetota bacterium]|jgi:AcrR family transcriptional regulator